jgi:hypothetical protein
VFQIALRTAIIIPVLTLPTTMRAHQAFTACQDQSFPMPATNGLGIDDQCSTSGSGSGAEAAQNKAKNNFRAGGPATPITIDELKALQADVQQNKKINSSYRQQYWDRGVDSRGYLAGRS